MNKLFDELRKGNTSPPGLDLLITRLPTIVDIDKMGIKELREQYKILEGDAISQAQQLSNTCAALHQMNAVAHDYSITFATLCDSYDAGDQAAILLMVKKLSEHRAAKKAKVH